MSKWFLVFPSPLKKRPHFLRFFLFFPSLLLKEKNKKKLSLCMEWNRNGERHFLIQIFYFFLTLALLLRSHFNAFCLSFNWNFEVKKTVLIVKAFRLPQLFECQIDWKATDISCYPVGASSPLEFSIKSSATKAFAQCKNKFSKWRQRGHHLISVFHLI